jgi:hypothetical protein
MDDGVRCGCSNGVDRGSCGTGGKRCGVGVAAMRVKVDADGVAVARTSVPPVTSARDLIRDACRSGVLVNKSSGSPLYARCNNMSSAFNDDNSSCK